MAKPLPLFVRTTLPTASPSLPHRPFNDFLLLRVELGLFSIGWLLLAWGNSFLGDFSPWSANFAAALALGASVCSGALVVSPHLHWAFQFGGALGVGAIGFRIVSLILTAGGSTAIQDAVLSITTTFMFIALYWTWWLRGVGQFYIRQDNMPSLGK